MKKLEVVKDMKNRQFFVRIFCYFSILLVLTVVIMAATYKVTNQGVKQQFYDKIRLNLNTSVRLLDGQVESVQNMGLNFFSSDVVRQYYKPRQQRSLAQEAEQWRICQLIQQNNNIFGETVEEMYVFFPGDGQVYTGAGVYEFSFFFENVCVYEKYPLDYWDNGISAREGAESMEILLPSKVSNTYGKESRDIIPFVTRQRVSGKPAVFMIELSSQEIRDLLTASSVIDGTRFVVLDDDGTLIMDSGSGAWTGEEGTDMLAQIAGGSGEVTYTYEGRQYLLFSEQSGNNPWHYISMVPVSSLNQVMNMKLYFIVGIGIAMALLGGCLALIFSLNIYRPIYSVIDVLSYQLKKPQSVDEIEFLQQGIESLVDNEKQYAQKIRTYDIRYVKHELQMIVNGILPSRQEELTQVLSAQYGFTGEFYVCCNVLFDFTLEFYQETEPYRQNDIWNQLNDILETLLDNVGNCCVLQMQNSSFTVIVNLEQEEETERLANELGQLERVFRDDSAYYSICIGIGSICRDLPGLAASYTQALFALKKRSEGTVFQIIQYDTLSEKKQVSFTFYDQKKIVNYIKTGNEERLGALVLSLLDENHGRGVTRRNMKELYHQVIAAAQRCMEEQDFSMEEIPSMKQVKAYFFRDEENLEYQTAKKLLVDFLLEVCAYLKRNGGSKGGRTIQQIRNYVAANYAQDLYLEKMGSDLGLSAKYMSKIFR